MDLFDNILYDLERSNEKFYGKRTPEEDEIYNNWLNEFEFLDITPFADANFLREFLNIIPKNEQLEYVKNTCMYHSYDNYDSNFVIVSRRAVPSSDPKPESFWSTEHKQIVSGLRNEMPLSSPQRLHSVIMISTLGSLEKHGIVSTENGATDAEIAIDPFKNFEDILFVYKPEYEMKELVKYLESGGISRDELLKQLKETAEERIERQGFKK